MIRLCHILLLALALSPVRNATADDAAPLRLPPAPRIVAIGDLHGDLNATRRALRLAGAIDEHDRWIGGKLVVVQTGDELDRGDDEQAILDLFARLAEEAPKTGGAVHALNGNHELMNAALDLRYVTPGGYRDFRDAVHVDTTDASLRSYPDSVRARIVALRPGGRYARVLAERNVVQIIGDNVFVHGGVLPEHVAHGLDRTNDEVRAWLRGDGPKPEYILKKGSLVWARNYSDEVDEADCATLRQALASLSAKRMIVGHTVQEGGIRPYCDGRVWCIDVGMAACYGGEVPRDHRRLAEGAQRHAGGRALNGACAAASGPQRKGVYLRPIRQVKSMYRE